MRTYLERHHYIVALLVIVGGLISYSYIVPAVYEVYFRAQVKETDTLVEMTLAETGLVINRNDDCPVYSKGLDLSQPANEWRLTRDRELKVCGCFVDTVESEVLALYGGKQGQVHFLCESDIITVYVN